MGLRRRDPTKAACLNMAEQQVDCHEDEDVCAAFRRHARKITAKSLSVAKLFAGSGGAPATRDQICCSHFRIRK